MAKEAKPKRNVYVGGLEEQVNEEMLHAAFVPFGDIVEVREVRLLLPQQCLYSRDRYIQRSVPEAVEL